MVEFDGLGQDGRAGGVPRVHRHGARQRRHRRRLGAEGPGPRRRRRTRTNPSSTTATSGWRGTRRGRSPSGRGARRRATTTTTSSSSRLSGAAGTRRRSSTLPNRYTTPSVATNARARSSSRPGSHRHRRAGSTTSTRDRAIAHRRVARHDADLARRARARTIYRDPTPRGGGSAFYVGWGVHGTGNQRTEIISTKPPGATCAASRRRPRRRPDATPTATPRRPPRDRDARPDRDPDPAPNPLPVPRRRRRPTPAPPAVPPPTPSAIADFTTLPAASKCVRGRKLTLRFKRPPKGYTVKTVTVKVNAKKVATLKGAKLKRPFYLRKLPPRDVHRHGLDHAEEGQGTDRAAALHGV